MKRKLFAKKGSKENSLSVLPDRPLQTTTPFWKLYQSCQKCPLDIFLDCLYENEFERLTIEGIPPADELEKAWNKLHAEYTGLMMSDSHSAEMELIQDLNILNAKCLLVDSAIQHLLVCYDKELVDILNALLLRCEVKESDNLNDTRRKLKQVAVRAKKMIAAMQLKQKELKGIQEQSKGESGREYYSKTLLILSKENGYAMREKDITVYQFVAAVNMLNKKVKKMETEARLKGKK